MVAQEIIKRLKLQTHPEGGFYREIYRAPLKIKPDGFETSRSACTTIYFLLHPGTKSALHLIDADEQWFFLEGDPFTIFELDEKQGVLKETILSRENPWHLVPAGTWFGSRFTGTQYSLSAAVVAPGFDFSLFTLASKSKMIQRHPRLIDFFEEMCELD
jgi:predicted cupin superfamily sugar epimerase